MKEGKAPKEEAGGRAESSAQVPLLAGRDYYVENGLYVFTSEFLLRRGYCCDQGCRHCPYKKEPK